MTNTLPPIPVSKFPGVDWPAIPGKADAAMLSLAYQLEQSQWLGPEDMLGLQLRQLERVLAHAGRTVPFYGQRLQVLSGLRSGGLTMEKWRKIPLLTRAEFQEAGAALTSHKIPPEHQPLTEVATSGSVGLPISIVTTGVTGTFFRALNLRYHTWHRRNFHAKAAAIRLLRGEQAKAAAQGRPSNWVPGHPSGPMHLFDITRPVGEQLEWLVRWDPVYLLTHPSNLAALVRRSRETGARPRSLRQATTMSEVVDPGLRDLCREEWGVDVTDAYSAQEVGMIALQCPDHPHYHEQAESVLVEVLDGNDAPCAPGQIGRVVVTDLHNFAMPLIRYEIGDLAEVGGTCPCGRGLPVLKRILGRVRNMAVLPSGDRFWPVFLSSEILRIAPVRQIQFVQTTPGDIEVKLVMADPMATAEEERLRDYLRGCFGYPFHIRFIYVDNIPRSAGGKFEDFVSAAGEMEQPLHDY